MEKIVEDLTALLKICQLAYSHDHVPNHYRLSDWEKEGILEYLRAYENYSASDMEAVILNYISKLKDIRPSEEWAGFLPPLVKDRFCANIKKFKTEDKLHKSLPEAILNSFDWDETPEHITYWRGVYEAFGGTWG